MSAERPRISVIIPHLNQPEFLDVCLKTLDAQSLGRDQFEVIVVDNGSSRCPMTLLRSIRARDC